MSDERRYGDDEVREILDLAVRDAQPVPLSSTQDSGITLSELQEIGREAGISPEQISRAAQAVAVRGGLLPRVRKLGMPVSVGRIIDLPREMTEREWDVLVGDLRAVFRASGHVSGPGESREWSNGNLRVTLEPTASGERLHMNTLKRSGEFGIRFGVGFTALGLIFLPLAILTIIGADLPLARALANLIPSLAVLGAGIGSLLWNRISLPGWASEREEQMAQIAARAHALTDEPEPTP